MDSSGRWFRNTSYAPPALACHTCHSCHTASLARDRCVSVSHCGRIGQVEHNEMGCDQSRELGAVNCGRGADADSVLKYTGPEESSRSEKAAGIGSCDNVAPSPKYCDNCEQNPAVATIHCKDCDSNYCAPCSTELHKFKTFAKHQPGAINSHPVDTNPRDP